jgi:molecular chaperone DnaK (HSP70)
MIVEKEDLKTKKTDKDALKNSISSISKFIKAGHDVRKNEPLHHINKTFSRSSQEIAGAKYNAV